MSRFEEIEAFVRIVRAGSISSAAQQLNVAKSAISKRLSDLEARLGVQLINRTTRRMNLTDPGVAFLKRASALLDDLAEAEAEASTGQKELSGKLKIAAPLSFGLIHLQPLLSRFATAHPNIELEIDFSDRRVDLIGEGVDVAVRIGVLADSTLIAKKLCSIRQYVAAAPSFWREHGRPAHPRDLQSLPCLRYSNLQKPDLIPFWGPSGEKGQLSADIKMLANNGDFLASMAMDGHGYLVEPGFFLFEEIEAKKLEPVLCDYAWSNLALYAVYPPARKLAARVRAFVDLMSSRFGRSPYWDEIISANEV